VGGGGEKPGEGARPSKEEDWKEERGPEMVENRIVSCPWMAIEEVEGGGYLNWD